MPATHPVFSQPKNPEVPLWRYMDFAKFVALLQNKSLHFARADLLGDEFEGSLPTASVSARRLGFQELMKKAPAALAARAELDHQKVIREGRRWTYVNCWHMNEHESVAMWEMYGRAGAGIAVQSTYARLGDCLPDMTFIGEVSYIDFARDEIPLGNVLLPYVTKRKSFEHEREVRAVVRKWPTEPEYDWLAPTETGIALPVDLERLIAVIHVAPKAPLWIEHLVRAVVATYGVRKEVRRSALDAAPLF